MIGYVGPSSGHGPRSLTLLMALWGLPPVLPAQRACPEPSSAARQPDSLPSLAGVWGVQLLKKSGISDSFRMELRATDSATQTFHSVYARKVVRSDWYLYYGVIDRGQDTIAYRRDQEFSWDPDRPGVRGVRFPQNGATIQIHGWQGKQ